MSIYLQLHPVTPQARYIRQAVEVLRKGGVIVVQEIFGIDEHVRRDVDRWASLGFEAIAPSLYDRREPGFVSGHDADGMKAGIGHAMPPRGFLRRGLRRPIRRQLVA